MSKFWKKNKSVILTSTVGVVALVAFLGLGYAYTNSSIGTDIVGVGAQVANLQYTGGTGNVYEMTTNLVEGPLTSSTNFNTLQNEINQELTSTIGDLVTEDEYQFASQTILQKYADEYNASSDHGEKFNALNINEKTLVILVSKGDSSDLEYASKILRHFRPVTYIGDDAGEVAGEEKFSISGSSFNVYAFGAVNNIYSNETNDVYRFRLRDGSNGKNASLWENGDYVKAEDIAFGISKQIPSKYASSAAYMLSDSIANIKNVGDAIKADSIELNEEQEEEKWGSNKVPDTIYSPAEKAIYYGWAPDDIGGYKREKVLHQEDYFSTFEDSSKIGDYGITFYDPDRDAEGNINDGEYSYVEFHLNSGSKTFPTQLSSVCYWPLNLDWYVDTIGWQKDLTSLGINEDTFLSSNAFNLTKFDNLYGIDAEKSNTYWDKDIVPSKSYTFRMVAESATQSAMFKTGQASFIRGDDENSKVLSSSKKNKEWMSYSGKTTAPKTKYAFWNMTSKTDEETQAGKFYKDPNFRRAMGALFNGNVYHKLSGIDSAPSISMFTPMGFLPDSVGNDLVDYGKATSIETEASIALGESGERIERYGTKERKEAVSNPLNEDDLSKTEGTRYNEDYANYYFSKFVSDMETLLGPNWDSSWDNVNGGKQLTIKFLSKPGVNPFLKTFQSVLNNQNFAFEPYEIKEDGSIGKSKNKKYFIELKSLQVPITDYMNHLKHGSDYDLGYISWGADYYDVWSTLGIFNQYESTRGSNIIGRWTYWDGSDFSFTPGIYGKDNDELARELFNDGLAQFFDGIGGESKQNIKSISQDTSLLNAGYYETLNIESVVNQLWDFLMEDSSKLNGETWSFDNRTTDGELDSYIDQGIIYGNHGSDFWSVSENEMAAYIILETIWYDSAPGYVGTTESGSTTPSRLIFGGDPVLGYHNRSFAFDVTKIPSDSPWKKVKKELLGLTPN